MTLTADCVTLTSCILHTGDVHPRQQALVFCFLFVSLTGCRGIFFGLESFGFKGATVTKLYFGISESEKKRGDPPFVMSRRAGTLIALPRSTTIRPSPAETASSLSPSKQKITTATRTNSLAMGHCVTESSFFFSVNNVLVKNK